MARSQTSPGAKKLTTPNMMPFILPQAIRDRMGQKKKEDGPVFCALARIGVAIVYSLFIPIRKTNVSEQGD